jgi:SagB-type dehydrogenase family enzyme
MRKTVRILAAVSASVVVLVVILYLAGPERGKLMSSKTTTVSLKGTLHLPSPLDESTISIEKALRERRSQREYRQVPLSLEEVGQLLWAAQGITHGRGFRTAPSAGALYPLETYLVAGKVTNLPSGVYRYLPHGHQLVPVLSGDMRERLCSASLNQEPVCSAPAAIVFSAVFARSTGKYGRRGIRYAHMEAGAAAQNISLQAVSLELGTVVIGAFDDDQVREVLSMPAKEDPLLIMPVGGVPVARPGK